MPRLKTHMFLNTGQFLWPKVVRREITEVGDGPDLVLWGIEKNGP